MPTIPPGESIGRAERDRINALVSLYAAAARRLAEIEQRLKAGGYSRRHVRARLNEARETIDRLLSIQGGQASGEVVEWAREHFPATYGYGAGQAVRDLRAQGIAPVAGDPRIHTRAVDSLIDRFVTDAAEVAVKLNANVIRTSRVVLAQAGFAEEIAAGIIGGLPRREVSRMLERELRSAVRGAVPDVAETDLTHVEIGGRRMRVEAWSEMHARTETARAATAGTRNMTVTNGALHVQITSHAHAPCICTPFEGRIYRIYQDRGDMRFPWIGIVPNGGTPMHPNCVHREAPAIIEFLEERGDVDGRAQIPEDFRGLNERELASMVREHADELDRYSRDRDGMLPEGFRLTTNQRRAA